MAHPVMWFEVLAQDGDRLRTFYGGLYGRTFTTDAGAYGVAKTGAPRGIPGGVGAEGSRAAPDRYACFVPTRISGAGAFFWGRKWTLAAWCELRNDFRNFRLDRASGSRLIDETFTDEPGKTLRDLLTQYGPDAVQLLDP